jgi:Ca-activated chloride channel family protein
MIELTWPWALLALPLPYVVRRLWPVAPPEASGALRVPFFRAVAAVQGDPAARGRRSLVLAAMSAAWLGVVLAATRPAWVGEPMPVPAEGRDLMLAVDLSGSMSREDFTVGGRPADRLTVVKGVAEDFIRRREGDRVGLILFGTRPYLQAPLTFDRATVETLLGESEVGLAGEETAIGDAIGLAVLRLRDRPVNSRVLVLLTDGASNAGAVDPIEAARLAAGEGIRIHTIGVGADRLAVHTAFGDRIVDPSADLDEHTLSEIATMTGGEYFRAKNVEGLANVYRRIDALEPATGEPLFLRPSRGLFHWPLGVALALSLAIAGGPASTALASVVRGFGTRPATG